MAEGDTDRSVSETERVSTQSSLYSRHSRTHVECVSAEVCNIITTLGYGDEIRRRRFEKYREWDMLWSERSFHATIITAGSKAEGLTCWLESDHDMLHVQNNTICVEAGVDLHTIPAYMEVYRMDTRVYPGHCRMLLERPNPIALFKCALCDDDEWHTLLSSAKVLDELSKCRLEGGVPLERSGPSLPVTDGLGYVMNQVIAVRCQCPSILQRRAQRPRHWLTPDIVQKVVSLGSVVTPVGCKGSEYRHLEWRICFNMGETELVSNLNGTQAKLYVILKNIVKEVLNPTNKEITSYVLKNIIFGKLRAIHQLCFKNVT